MTTPEPIYLTTTYNNPKHLEVLGRPRPKRMTSSTHKSRVVRIIDRAERSLRVSGSRFVHVGSLMGRNDFGDLDFVLHSDYAPQGWQERLSTGLGKVFWAQVPGTNTSVFDDDGYQVNIHVTPPNTYPSVLGQYLKFGSLGNLLRIMYENLGLTMHKYLPVLKGDYPGASNFTLEESEGSANVILGYSSEQFAYDTFTKNDLFLQIRSCRYFNRQLFLDYAANPDNAQEMVKDHLLRDFVAHLNQDTNTNRESVFTPASDAGKIWALNLKKRYGSSFRMFLEEKNNYELAQLHLTKLNVNIVKDITGLTSDEDAAKVIEVIYKRFKKDEDFNLYLTTSMSTTIRKEVLEVHEAMSPKQVVVPALAEAVVNVEVEKKVRSSKPEVKAKPKAKPKAKVSKPKKALPKAVPETPAWPVPTDARYTTAA